MKLFLARPVCGRGVAATRLLGISTSNIQVDVTLPPRAAASLRPVSSEYPRRGGSANMSPKAQTRKRAIPAGLERWSRTSPTRTRAMKRTRRRAPAEDGAQDDVDCGDDAREQALPRRPHGHRPGPQEESPRVTPTAQVRAAEAAAAPAPTAQVPAVPPPGARRRGLGRSSLGMRRADR